MAEAGAVIGEEQPEDEDSEAEAADLRRLREADLLALADEPSEHPDAKEAS